MPLLQLQPQCRLSRAEPSVIHHAQPAQAAFTESPFPTGRTCSASTAETPFQQQQQQHFPQPWALTARSAAGLHKGELSLENVGTAMVGPAVGEPLPNESQQKGWEGCAPRQCSCPCSCSQHSLSQQLSMAQLDTGGRQGQTLFVKLIPDILPYTCTLKRGLSSSEPGSHWG